MNQLNNQETVRQWLMDNLSATLNIGRSRLDADAPLTRFGLSSLDAVTLVMDLEDQLGIELSPTLLWEYPTINKCAAHIATLER